MIIEFICCPRMRMPAFAAAHGEAYGFDSMYVLAHRHTFVHEIGHNMGLNHCGTESNGRYREYDGHTSAMSNSGYSFHSLDLRWLRVIHRNILPITASASGLRIKSLTSISEGYTRGDGYSKFAEHVAAAYQSPDDGPEYLIEWREMKRQDKLLDAEFFDSLLIHHMRDNAWRTINDAVLPVGKSWTCPRGDLTVTHTGPVGTFDVRVGPVTNPNARVNFFNWNKYWTMIKQQKLDEVARSAQRETRRTGLTDAQLNDRDFLHRLIEMCETHNDPRCGTARARLAEIER